VLKITPYLGFIVPIVVVAGLWYPILGYIVPVILGAIIFSSPFRGRWFCGNLCPHGSFADFWVSRITLSKKIPVTFRRMAIRIPLLIVMMSFMILRVLNTAGVIEKIGMIFVTMYIMTASAIILLGTFISPRAWCSVCPMGTLSRILGGGKHPLKIDVEACTNCGACSKACPMQLSANDGLDKPDCIICERCIEACPKGALSLKSDIHQVNH
jgi:polyferredoxin